MDEVKNPTLADFGGELHQIYDEIRKAKTRLLEITGCCFDTLTPEEEEVFEGIDDNLLDAKEALWAYVK